MIRSRLVFPAVLAAALAALAVPSAALANHAPHPRAGAPVSLKFHIAHMPTGTLANVTFDSSVQAIGTQIAAALMAGNIRVFIAQQDGFAITAASGGAPLDASIDEQADTAKGATAISGQALVPGGTALTVQVNGGPPIPVTGAFTIPLSALGKSQPHLTHPGRN
jgi:hypothetical protein